MTDPNPTPGGKLLEDAKEEVVGIAKGGFSHPSTVPVLTGAFAGAVAGALLPVLSVPVGLIAGAAIVLYKRVRP